MRASGNGNPQRCAENLLATVRGEVPFDRLRGLNARNIDGPANEATAAMEEDAAWVLSTYEPRAEVQDITATIDGAAEGGFRLTADIE